MEETLAAAKANSRLTLWGAIWRSLMVIGVVYVVIQIFATLIVALVMLLFGLMNGANPASDFQVHPNTIAFGAIVTAIASLYFVKFLTNAKSPVARSDLRLKMLNWRYFVIPCLAVIAFVVGETLISFLLDQNPFSEEDLASLTSTTPILLFLWFVIFVPVQEEVIFRGYVSATLETAGVSTLSTAFLSSLLFALMHLQYNWYGMLVVFGAGLLLAWARIKTGSILPGMVMHSIANLVAFLAIQLIPETFT